MESIDLARTEKRARRAYELARLRRALLAMAPMILVVVVAAGIGDELATVGVGAGALLLGIALLWFGRDPGRSTLPGVVAGLVPMVLALCMKVGAASMGVCATACGIGGLAAGVGVGWAASRAPRPRPTFWLGATAMALLTGSMGSVCGGRLSVVALVVGYGVGLAAGLHPWIRRGTDRVTLPRGPREHS